MSSFRCTKCNTVMTIPTRKKQLRPKGHIKTMWCWKCKGTRQFKLLA